VGAGKRSSRSSYSLNRKQPSVDLTSVQIAQALAGATPGFNSIAKTTKHLRELIAG
jgi:hypothetical protein